VFPRPHPPCRWRAQCRLHAAAKRNLLKHSDAACDHDRVEDEQRRALEHALKQAETAYSIAVGKIEDPGVLGYAAAVRATARARERMGRARVALERYLVSKRKE
jgi:hypothetical protein